MIVILVLVILCGMFGIGMMRAHRKRNAAPSHEAPQAALPEFDIEAVCVDIVGSPDELPVGGLDESEQVSTFGIDDGIEIHDMASINPPSFFLLTPVLGCP